MRARISRGAICDSKDSKKHQPIEMKVMTPICDLDVLSWSFELSAYGCTINQKKVLWISLKIITYPFSIRHIENVFVDVCVSGGRGGFIVEMIELGFIFIAPKAVEKQVGNRSEMFGVDEEFPTERGVFHLVLDESHLHRWKKKPENISRCILRM